jgi:hypothetical protein
LDGVSFTLSAIINDNFLLGTTSYIPRNAAFIRNWDRSNADTNSECASDNMSACFMIEEDSASPSAFALDNETADYASLETQRILATKTSDHEIGKWRIYPEFSLNIPPRTPPGHHTTTITFSLI